MGRIVNSILVILVSLALLTAGASLLGTLLAVRLTQAGFATQYIGPILACHSLGFVAGTRYAAPIIRRVGHIRSFAAFAAVACVAALVHPLYVDGITWALLRAVFGFCGAGLAMVMESWINDRTSNDLRGSVMAFYMATSYLAQGGGQLVLGLGEPGMPYLFMIAAMFIAASLVPLALTRSKAPSLAQHEPMGLRKLYAVAPIGAVGALLGGAAMSGFMAVLPVYAIQARFGLEHISVLMGVMVLFGMAAQWPLGFFSDRHDRRGLVVLLGLLAALVSIPLALTNGRSFTRLMLLGGLFVGLAGGIYPLCVAITNDYLESHQMVSASAALLLIFGMGTIVGPVAGSAAMGLLGPRGLFVYTALTMLALGGFGLWRYLRARRLPVSKQQEYVPVSPASTPVILEIDPRNLDFVPAVVVPAVERRGARGDRRGAASGGRRRTDGADFNE